MYSVVGYYESFINDELTRFPFSSLFTRVQRSGRSRFRQSDSDDRQHYQWAIIPHGNEITHEETCGAIAFRDFGWWVHGRQYNLYCESIGEN